MANIGGNITGTIQKKASDSKNAIGERVTEWKDVFNPVGWLGLQSGDSKYNNFSAKLEESTHVFLCDFDADVYALSLPDEKGNSAIVRMVIKGIVYDVLLIDNPDEMGEQLEIYLRRVGAWDGRHQI